MCISALHVGSVDLSKFLRSVSCLRISGVEEIASRLKNIHPILGRVILESNVNLILDRRRTPICRLDGSDLRKIILAGDFTLNTVLIGTLLYTSIRENHKMSPLGVS